MKMKTNELILICALTLPTIIILYVFVYAQPQQEQLVQTGLLVKDEHCYNVYDMKNTQWEKDHELRYRVKHFCYFDRVYGADNIPTGNEVIGGDKQITTIGAMYVTTYLTFLLDGNYKEDIKTAPIVLVNTLMKCGSNCDVAILSGVEDDVGITYGDRRWIKHDGKVWLEYSSGVTFVINGLRVIEDEIP
jgi:hypothetical protein